MRRLSLLNLFAVVTFTSVGFAAPAAVCTFESTTGNAKAICQMPACPEGSDCTPPQIDRSTAQVDFQEPVIKWKASCGEKPTDVAAGCWEAYFDFRIRLGVTDAVGVGQIGARLSVDVGDSRDFRKYLVKVGPRGSDGRYEATANLALKLPADRKIQLAVDVLCARDLAGNESCVLPLR